MRVLGTDFIQARPVYVDHYMKFLWTPMIQRNLPHPP